ncbi:hypothetical protein P9D39_16395 [Heyndrickxia oleronia]|uniref:Uncharacterized protein n=1 Tax=Heyndrickxia oleronia TaxID=38875 RepID=A0A8E2I3Q6_9BACI|nr:hypothetical protein [Heyndrickxia oleronia]MEC1375872.1 hypothetical protein [Heyndrickxia oleronia]OOP65787.1 hypothetical protein BWZ43_24415 [Heyndrickxia oleronia]QQZ05588.1 hypothetical protein I5818_03570 [Heyndrickxia oleronia]
MTLAKLTLQELVAFHGESVGRNTAFNYIDLLENSKTPFIFVEKGKNKKFNVIGGFKYVDGIRCLQKEKRFLCLVLDSFPSAKDRKIATLQRCLALNEKVIYKEILIHELIHKFKMDESSISKTLGIDAKKIQKYMFKQIIPKTYYDRANTMGIKGFIQAIYLNKQYTDFEKQLLTELILHPIETKRFKLEHKRIYNKYRKQYPLFDDFCEAKKQVMDAVLLEDATQKHWSSIPHPSIPLDLDSTFRSAHGRTH